MMRPDSFAEQPTWKAAVVEGSTWEDNADEVVTRDSTRCVTFSFVSLCIIDDRIPHGIFLTVFALHEIIM